MNRPISGASLKLSSLFPRTRPGSLRAPYSIRVTHSPAWRIHQYSFAPDGSLPCSLRDFGRDFLYAVKTVVSKLLGNGLFATRRDRAAQREVHIPGGHRKSLNDCG